MSAHLLGLTFLWKVWKYLVVTGCLQAVSLQSKHIVFVFIVLLFYLPYIDTDLYSIPQTSSPNSIPSPQCRVRVRVTSTERLILVKNFSKRPDQQHLTSVILPTIAKYLFVKLKWLNIKPFF